MATLQNTTVPDNGYYRVGTTNTAYVSSGGAYAHFGLSAWFDGTAWQGAGGPVLQLTTNNLQFYMNPVVSGIPIFSTGDSTTTIASTSTTINGTLGVGAAAVTGQILVNAGDAAGNVKPVLEVTNCLGDGSASTATKSVFKGFLGIQVGSVVGPATSVVAGTYNIRLWGT